MAIAYFGKKSEDKFAFCSVYKAGESGTFLLVDYAQFRIVENHLYLFGKSRAGDFTNFNNKSWELEKGELIAVRMTIKPYESEYQGKKKEYIPSQAELALLKIIMTDSMLSDGSIMFTATIDLGQSSEKIASKILEGDINNDSIKPYLTNIIDIDHVNPFSESVAGYSLNDVNKFIESKTNSKSQSYGKSKYKNFDERVESIAKILNVEPNFLAIYNEIKTLDPNVLMALIELMKLI